MTVPPLADVPPELLWEFAKKLVDPRLIWAMTRDAAKGALRGLSALDRRRKTLRNLGVTEFSSLSNSRLGSVYGVRDLSGDIGAFTRMKPTQSESILDVARRFQAESPRDLASSEATAGLRRMDRLKWESYGSSIQSDLPSGCQLLQLAETDEANSVPVVISAEMWQDLHYAFLQHSPTYRVRVSGAVLSADAKELNALLGVVRATEFRERGHLNVVVADERLVSALEIDVDVRPGVDFLGPTDVYLGYLWAAFRTSGGALWPVFEYANIADPRFRGVATDLLLARVRSYHRYAWSGAHQAAPTLTLASTDDLFDLLSNEESRGGSAHLRSAFLEALSRAQLLP